MPPEVFQFEDVTVDLRRMSVSRAGHPIPLEPKSFDVLRHLIEHRDRLVTKEELLDAAWKDTFVTPNVLTRAVAQLRKALGDDAFEARYIETVAKRGYRFIAPVEEMLPTVVSAPPLAPSQRRMPVVALALLLIAAVGTGLFLLFNRESAEPLPPAALSPRRITTGSASYHSPAVSLDGRMIAFASNETGSSEIYTAGSAPGMRQLAITTDAGQNMFPAWSADGQWLAYHSRKKGGIWVVPSTGGVARQVVDFGSQASWTPDGERLIFTSTAGGMAAQATLWSVRRDGTNRKAVTTVGAPRGGHHYPSVSRDGRLIAFGVSHGSITMEVWTIPIDGGTGVKLGVGSAYGGPQFSRDGLAVYWIGRTPEGNDALMRRAIDPSGAPAGVAENVLTVPGNLLGGFSIASDGTAVLLMARATANLFAIEVPQKGLAGNPIQLTSEEARLTQPHHSRNGRIVFNQLAVGQPNSVWLMDEDGENREMLSVGFSESVFGGQWSPDGKRVLAMTSGPDIPEKFVWLDVATRTRTPVPLAADGMLSPSLSPDGRELAFHVIDEGGVLNVWRQALDGSPRTQVTFDKEAMSYPVWAPDGNSIAVEVKRGDHTFIGVVPRDGGPVELIVTDRGQNWPHGWSPDGEHIVFAGARNGVWNIYTVSRKTEEIRQLTDFTEIQGYVRYPSWSLTRDAIVFERAEQRGSLWTIKLP
ncbi:MAG TPA: winged helix-turn-helix domain-containing protein [Vicinamibacterales bacterium]